MCFLPNKEKKLDGTKENINHCYCRSWQLVVMVKYTFCVTFLCAGQVNAFLDGRSLLFQSV